MYAANLQFEISCPRHPDFDPTQEAAPKRCRPCAVIANTQSQIKMIERSVYRFESGFYANATEEPEESAPAVETVHIVAAPEKVDEYVEKTISKKKGVQVKKAPQKIEATA